jgi:hypothetical protein
MFSERLHTYFRSLRTVIMHLLVNYAGDFSRSSDNCLLRTLIEHIDDENIHRQCRTILEDFTDDRTSTSTARLISRQFSNASLVHRSFNDLCASNSSTVNHVDQSCQRHRSSSGHELADAFLSMSSSMIAQQLTLVDAVSYDESMCLIVSTFEFLVVETSQRCSHL